MDESGLVAYLMYTPIEKIPPMPYDIQSEANTQLGLDILELLQSKKIEISHMSKDGLLGVLYK